MTCSTIISQADSSFFCPCEIGFMFSGITPRTLYILGFPFMFDYAKKVLWIRGWADAQQFFSSTSQLS